MIEDLLAEGRYQEALESLEDREDEQVRYYRLICLYGLGLYKEGLEEAKAAKMLASDTYYDVLCYYVSFLKENELYEDAINTLVEELSMPYIPYQYESKLNESYDELLLLKREAYAVYEDQTKILSNDDLELYLTKGASEEIATMALQQLAAQNIRRFMPSVRLFLKDDERSSIEKSMLLEILKEQEVDEDLEIRKHQHTIDVNPIYLESIVDSYACDYITGLYQTHIEQENPSLYELCLEFLLYYLYDWYPMLEMIEDYESCACAIHYYVATLSLIEVDKLDLVYMYGADEYAVDEILGTLSSLAIV